ncbi:hypothetical protein NPIL_439841 [Nephila pilipes]|uniref:Uncharacterized protein n=1 Tax=Nephila pilipes TaxID=299642 RepID=A0A8X6PQ05_NEPPI|nr:hypothetical protein NPIL_439841 [Nephila pilipes]
MQRTHSSNRRNGCSWLANFPSTTSLAVTAELNALYTAVCVVLHIAKINPFHIQKIQFLTEDDYFRREQFVIWIFDVNICYISQFSKVFINQVSLTHVGIVNTHNSDIWVINNLHANVP